ncbi:hypothetical protein LCGC14_2302360 [marine sediment metagenome]|uniref:Uncharacterized protein n=1 Tax=marine sediment metagenome TaxID=412755 RepID=A0A0F9F0J9_9ZZZZ
MKTLIDDISKKRHITTKYALANTTEEQNNAVMVLLDWLPNSEDKAEYLLFIEGIDRLEAFSVPFLNIIVQLSAYDPVLLKATELGIIKRK